MVIHIPIRNLRGVQDNGFANISNFSEHSIEREVLVNAFNVFKILSFYSEIVEDLLVHTLHLEFGSLRPIERKVEKNENLLEAEYFWKMNVKELKLAREKLEDNKAKMTKEGYEKLA